MHIATLFSNSEIGDSLTLPLEGTFNAKVDGFNADKDLIQKLQSQDSDFDIIIMDYAKGSFAAIGAVLKEMDVAPLVLLCAPADTDVKANDVKLLGMADYGNLMEEVTALIEKVSKAFQRDEEENEIAAKYCRIQTSLLVKVSPLKASVYIRLSPTKFLRLFSEGDVFDGKDLERYGEQKKVQHMYLEKENTNLFIDKLNTHLLEVLKMEPLDQASANEVIEESVDVIHELINTIGVTPEVQEVVNTNIDLAKKSMGEFPELANILKSFEGETKNYIAFHSTMLAQVACSLAVAVDWYSDTTFEKLTMAAFIHDVAIKNEDLCRVKDMDEMNTKYQGQFSAKEIAQYKKHPVSAANFAKGFKQLGAEVDKIILQHHENPMGTGFPDGLTHTYITPLAALFIVAHDLTDYCIDNNGKIDPEEYLLANQQKFSNSNFKKIFQSIVNMAL